MQYLKVLIVCLVISGCVVVVDQPTKRQSQLAISSVWDIPKDFPVGATFKLVPKYIEDASYTAEQQQSIYQIYADAITQSMVSRGYQHSNTTADINLGFGVALSQDLSDVIIGEKFGVTPGLQAFGDFEKGSFLIYIEDADSSQRVWRGAVQGFVQDDYSMDERAARAAKIANMLLVHFYKAG